MINLMTQIARGVAGISYLLRFNLRQDSNGGDFGLKYNEEVIFYWWSNRRGKIPILEGA